MNLLRVVIVGAITVLGLASCGANRSTGVEYVPSVASRSQVLPTDLPPMKAFAGSRTDGPSRPNSEIAGDFLDLAFQLESGRTLPVLSRFEGPITLALRGDVPVSMQADLDRLLQRLNGEAGIDIRVGTEDGPASITVEVIKKRDLQRLVPHAACFVAPNVSSWAEYKRTRHGDRTDWTRLSHPRTDGGVPAGRRVSRRRCAIACTRRSPRRSGR